MDTAALVDRMVDCFNRHDPEALAACDRALPQRRASDNDRRGQEQHPDPTAIIRRTALVTSPSTRSGRFAFPPAGQGLPAGANPACRRASASRPTCSSPPEAG
jgi:hypothetical protein